MENPDRIRSSLSMWMVCMITSQWLCHTKRMWPIVSLQCISVIRVPVIECNNVAIHCYASDLATCTLKCKMANRKTQY